MANFHLDGEDRSGSGLADVFREYDLLIEEASDLNQRSETFETARKHHEESSTRLESCQKDMTKTVDCIDEQTTRIKLVSKHWFYGTTALQPQLWLRGGCEGKIQRAQAKLVAAEQERPRLETLLASCREEEQAARRTMKEAEKSLNETKNAKEKAQRLRKGLIEQNLTEELRKLQKESEELQQGIQKLDQYKQHFASIKSWIQSVRKITDLVEGNTKTAEGKLTKASKLEQQKETPVFANQEEPGHCCSGKDHQASDSAGIRNENGMQDGGSFRQKHFPKQEERRKQREAQEKEKAMQKYQQRMDSLDPEIQRKRKEYEQRENERLKKVERLRGQASNLLEEAYKELDRGDELLRRIEKGLHEFSLQSQAVIQGRESGSSCACGTLDSQGRELRIRANRMSIHADGFDHELSQKIQQTDIDTLQLKEKRDKILSHITMEEETIFEWVRQSVSSKRSEYLSDSAMDVYSLRPPPVNPALLPTAPILE